MAVFLRLQYYLVHQNRLTSVHDYYILYVQVETTENNSMGYLEVIGVMWVITKVFGNDVLMICVSGCMT